MKKAIKKITAVGTGMMLLGTSLMGASAALEDFPQPFVTSNGVADVQFVIGSGATDDYLGALDIATSLQAAAVSEESVSTPGSSTTVEVEGGVLIESSGDALNLNEQLDEATVKFDSDDLPELLADGMVVDDDVEKEEYDYEQEIELGTAEVKYGNPDDNVFDGPVVYLDLESQVAYELVVDFKDALKLSDNGNEGEGLDDSETIEMFGKTFTFKTDISDDEDIIMYGSDTTSFLELNEPVTVETNGETYTVEIVGANSESSGGSTIILDVNGNRKTVEEGDSTTIGGLEIFVQDLFVTNIPTLSASANLFVGSDEVKIPAGAEGAWDDVEVNGVELDGYEVFVTSTTDWEDITEIRFRFTPSDLDNEVEWLVEGEELVDPLFETLKLQFEGPSIALDSESREMLTFERSGANYVLSFENEDGDMYELDLVEEEAGSLLIADDLGDDVDSIVIAANTNIAEDAIFIVSEGTAGAKSEVTKIYQVVDVDNDEDEVTFEDLSDGSEIVVTAGDQLEDTGYYVYEDASAGTTNIAGDNFELGNAAGNAGLATLNYIVTENDVTVTFGDINTTGDTMQISVEEDSFGDVKDEMDSVVMNFTIGLDSDSDIAIVSETAKVSGSGAVTILADDDSDYKYGLTEQGLYFVEEIDNDGNYLRFYTVDEEVTYNAFIAPEGASVITSGGSNVMTQMVNPIGLGIATRDVDVNLANPAKNLIVVGGTCINSVAAQLKEVAAGTCGTESGLNPNEAIIELFDLDNGKVAMLVAGWEATETQAAARAVASQDSALTGDSATLTVTSATNYQIQ